MNGGCSGLFTRLHDDQCAYKKYVAQSIGPINHALYMGKHENCNKCVHDENSFHHPFDAKIVDVESDLTGRTRRGSVCPEKKYSPLCNKSKNCISTFDKTAPIVLPGEVCPIVTSGMIKPTKPIFGANAGMVCNHVQRTQQ
jgi:hypothetical protein